MSSQLKRISSHRSVSRVVAIPLATLGFVAAACGGGGEDATGTTPHPASSPGAAPAAAGQAAPAGAPALGGPDAGPADPLAKLPPLPVREFQERDFAETDQSRDPFRNFAQVFTQQAEIHSVHQVKVLVERYALDELKLVGIVLGAPSRALLTDPTGLGWVAKVGDFVGKSELVHAGGPMGADIPVNWRVDRIRDGDIVFVREDPSHPEIPPSTRVIALRTPEEEAGQKGTGK